MILALAPESLLTVSAKTKQCVHTAVLASPLRHLSSLRGRGNLVVFFESIEQFT